MLGIIIGDSMDETGKVLAYRLDPFEAEPAECICILLIIPAAEIDEMTLKDRM